MEKGAKIIFLLVSPLAQKAISVYVFNPCQILIVFRFKENFNHSHVNPHVKIFPLSRFSHDCLFTIEFTHDDSNHQSLQALSTDENSAD